MKKTVLSLVVAGALLVTGPLVSSAESLNGSKKEYKERYVVAVTNNPNWNKLVQSLFKKYYFHYYQTQPTIKTSPQTNKDY